MNAKDDWSCAASPLQGSLHPTLGCFPTTAGDAQFCLLCYQPEPIPESLPARPPFLTRGCPCSPPVWFGQPSTRLAGRTTLHLTPSVTTPLATQRGVDLHRYTWKSKLFRWCVFKCVGTMLSRHPSDAATAHRFRPHVQNAPASRKRLRASRNCRLASWNASFQRL